MYKVILTSVYEKECGIFVPFPTVVNVRHPVRGYVKNQGIFAPNLGNVFSLKKVKIPCFYFNRLGWLLIERQICIFFMACQKRIIEFLISKGTKSNPEFVYWVLLESEWLWITSHPSRSIPVNLYLDW
jgi:hypothetical protein